VRPTDPVLVELPEGHEAVRIARRVVGEECARAGLVLLADDAKLVASELVGNAVLYSGGPSRLAVIPCDGGIRLEVHDRSPVPPVLMNAPDGAMTGRGLRVVAALVRSWGVTQTDGGKVVWAEIGVANGHLPELLDAELSQFWDDEESGRPERYHVSLGNVPTHLLLDAKAHVDNLVREFTLAAAGAEAGMTRAVPAQLADVIERVVNGFADARQSIKRQAVRVLAPCATPPGMSATMPGPRTVVSAPTVN